MDTPYYVRNVFLTGRGEEHQICRPGDGHVATAFSYGMAHRIIDALNAYEAKKKAKEAARAEP